MLRLDRRPGRGTRQAADNQAHAHADWAAEKADGGTSRRASRGASCCASGFLFPATPDGEQGQECECYMMSHMKPPVWRGAVRRPSARGGY